MAGKPERAETHPLSNDQSNWPNDTDFLGGLIHSQPGNKAVTYSVNQPA